MLRFGNLVLTTSVPRSSRGLIRSPYLWMIGRARNTRGAHRFLLSTAFRDPLKQRVFASHRRELLAGHFSSP